MNALKEYGPDVIESLDLDDLVDYYHSSSLFITNRLTLKNEQDDGMYLGMEIEVKTTDSEYGGDRAETAKQMLSRLSRQKWAASEDAVPGIEVKTAPATLNYIHNTTYINDFYNTVKKYVDNEQGDEQSKCGIHVHIDKKTIKAMDAYKMAKLVYENTEFTKTIAGRDFLNNQYCGRVPMYGRHSSIEVKTTHKASIEDINKSLELFKKSGYPDDIPWNAPDSERVFVNKFTAINLTHGETIEFRIFKSDITPQFIKSAFEYAHSVASFAKEASVSDVSVDNYIAYIKRNYRKYPNLNKRIKAEWLAKK